MSLMIDSACSSAFSHIFRIDDGFAVAHGNGGMLGSRHCAGTVILGRD